MDETITSTILNSMSDGVLVFDLTGHLVFVNDAACTSMLLDKARAMDGTYADLFMSDQENDAFNDILLSGIQDGKVHLYREVSFRRPDGREVELAVTTSILKDAAEQKGKAGGIVMVFKDITQSKALDRARGRVIDHLSHELKTPLAIVSATIKSLGKGEDNPRIQRIEQNLKRLKEIQQEVEDIVRRADEGRRGGYGLKTAKPECLRLGSLTNEIVKETRESSAHRNVMLLADAEGDFSVQIDEDAFRKALTALVKNAVEATPDGGRVDISFRLREDRVEVAVKDSGVGITEESLREVFGGFYHARETDLYSTKKPFDFDAGGKGLDLLRLKVLSQTCDFDIECESTRCRFMPGEDAVCPGSIDRCSHVTSTGECISAGGTTFKLLFKKAAKL
ncbi:MAG: domain S-box [Deltaproteobacteria bacterium]|nr:domain S-box [Deltaproteobacteria bacterium]